MTCDRLNLILTCGVCVVVQVPGTCSTAVVTQEYTFLKEIQNGFDLWYLSIYLLRVFYQRVGITHEGTRNKMGPRKVCCCTPRCICTRHVCAKTPPKTPPTLLFLYLH